MELLLLKENSIQVPQRPLFHFPILQNSKINLYYQEIQLSVYINFGQRSR